MKKITILFGKKLKIKKVLCRRIEGILINLIDKIVLDFVNDLKLLNAQSFEPLIIRNKGTKISEEGNIISDYNLYIQAHDYKQYKNQFNVLDELVVENCLYTRFEGKPEYLQLAFNKLEIYEYEEDIVTRGDIFMVSLEDSPEKIVMDIFKPVKML